MPIESVHLRESGLGRIVMFYAHPPTNCALALQQDPAEIQRIARELIVTWSKPYLGRRQHTQQSFAQGSSSLSKPNNKNGPM